VWATAAARIGIKVAFVFMLRIFAFQETTMQPHVTLTFTEGCLEGRDVVLDHCGYYVVGRSTDCDICMPADERVAGVSRHHCVLVVDPPAVRVRDLGSRNGTFLNGAKIGQRSSVTLMDNTGLEDFTEFPVHDGDELRVDKVVIRVNIEREDDTPSPSN